MHCLSRSPAAAAAAGYARRLRLRLRAILEMANSHLLALAAILEIARIPSPFSRIIVIMRRIIIHLIFTSLLNC